MATRDIDEGCLSHDNEMMVERETIERLPPTSRTVRTPSRFNLMELPVELRLKIYKQLFPNATNFEFPRKTSILEGPEYPSTSLLLTCRLINHEATPILYSNITLTIHMSPTYGVYTALSPFRFSTLAHIPKLIFTNGSQASPISASTYACSGFFLLDAVPGFGSTGKTWGPEEEHDSYRLHSMSTYVSFQVMGDQIKAFHEECRSLGFGDAV